MGLRELLILILILAIVGVILRGLFVALRARRGQLRMSLAKNIPQYDPEELSISELPNGGARMVERSFAEVVRQNSEFSSRQGKGKSEHAIPVLMDSVEDEDDEEASSSSSSGVANARQLARQKHLLGTARPRPPQRPTHRPIDRMARSAAGTDATVSSVALRTGAELNPAAAPKRASTGADESGFDLEYDDPLDSHVFKNTEDDDVFSDDTAPPASFDDAYDEYAYDEQSYETAPAPAPQALSSADSRADSASAWEMEEEDYNEGGLEESIDEAVAETPGQSTDAVIAHAFEEAYADEELESPDDDYLDDEEDDLNDDLRDDDLHDDDLHDDDLHDEYLKDEALDNDDDYDDDEDEEDDDELEDYEDEPVQTDATYDDDDDEYDDAEAFESVYADDEDDDEYDDDFADDDYADEPMDEPKSGPRRWLQWAGDKLASMSAATAEPIRAPEIKHQDQRVERAEPTISAASFDEVMAQPTAPVAHAPTTTPKRPQPSVQPAPAAALDRSQQNELNLDEPAEAELSSPRAMSAPAPEQVPAPAPVTATHVQANAGGTTSTTKNPLNSNGTTAKPVPTLNVGADLPAKASVPEPTIAADYSEVLVFNIFAKPDREFAGVELLQNLLSAGLHFGEMSIFHRHLGADISSPVVFSVANLVNPGTFDLNQISAFSTKGLCFFMTLPNVVNSMQAFDKMLDAAQQIRIALDGDLKDDNRSVMTAQTIEHYRQRVRDFELRQLRQPK